MDRIVSAGYFRAILEAGRRQSPHRIKAVDFVHVRVLGRAVVERGGVPLRGRAVQSHNLALLAVLAASPGYTASRDRLIGLLWPESESARARHRLSVALHAIRRDLGRDAVLTSGDAVALNPAVVRTDLGAFQEAIDAGRLEEAVGVCAGPFMDGFYLRDGADFERWSDKESVRIAGLCRSALERLADDAEGRGDHRALAKWRRRLAALAPYESSAALALMKALASAGDAAGALAHARAYVTRVEADLGIPANPAVMKLADELAESIQYRRVVRGPGAPEPPASELREAPPAPGQTERSPRRSMRLTAATVAVSLTVVAAFWISARRGAADATEGVPSVVILPFQDLGDGPSMGARLAHEIGRTLTIVPNLDVRDPGSEARAASGDEGWRRIARDADAARAITGAVRTNERWAEATFQLRDASSGETLWEATEQRELRSTDALVEALSMAIADDLRTRLARYIPHHYTDSESANEAFLKGVYEHRKADEQQMWVALQHYRRAWEEDSSFALAHAIAGTAYMQLSQSFGLGPDIGWERGREHVMRAIELDPTLPEAYSVLGRLQLWWDRDYEAAEATLRRAIMLYPTHPDARTWYALYQLYCLNDFDGALANIRRALEFDPLSAWRSNDVELVLYQTRHYDEAAAQREHTRAINADVAASLLNYRVASAYREMGLYDEAIAEYESVHATRGGPTPVGLGITYAKMGRLGDARAVLREHEARVGFDGLTGSGFATLYALLGDKDRAFELLDRMVATDAPHIFHLKTGPALDPLRSDPRFDDLLRRMGFALD